MVNFEVMKGALREEYGVGLFEDDKAVAVRIPKNDILDIDEEDVKEIGKKRDIIQEYLKRDVEVVYVIAEKSYLAIDPGKFMDYILSEVPEVQIEWGEDGIKVGYFDMANHGIRMALWGVGGGMGPGGLGGEGRGRGPLVKATTSKIVVKGVGSVDTKKIQNILSILSKTGRKVVSGHIKSGRRTSVITVGKRGRYVRYRLPPSDKKDVDVALLPTIRAAAQRGQRDPKTGRLIISPSDVREKIRRRKISTMICLVFDTSGSLNQEKKLEVTKQVINALLLDAYQKRDRIALVTYGGDDAKIAMPFTSSVDAAKKYLETITFGGTTPLSAGLLKGYQLLKIEIAKDPESTPLLILMTDGTANKPISFGANIKLELLRVCKLIKDSNIRVLVIDTSPDGSPLAMEIAEAMDGRYFHPGGLTKEKIYSIISAAKEDLKAGMASVIDTQRFMQRIIT